MTTTDSNVRSGTTRITGSGNKSVELEVDCEETSRQRGKIRVSTSTKLPGTNRVTIHPRLSLGAVNQTVDTTSDTSRSETTTSTSREERRQDRSSLM